MRSVSALLAATAITALTTLSAFAADRVVNVYNWSDYVDEEVLEAFTKETGIKVVYDVYDSNEILESKLFAGGSGYDVAVPTDRNMQRMLQAGILVKLDKSKLPNLKHMWPEIMQRLATYDPGNQYAVDYMWGTTGIGYNVDKVKERLGDMPLDSWDLLFKPEVVAKLKDCGIHLLDSADDLIPAALNYLGLPPGSTKQADLDKAGALLKKIRPNIQKFHSSEYINALANGDICLAVGYSGDVLQARDRADEANNNVTVDYLIPKEGALMWLDAFIIPKDAPHKAEAHEFINYMMRPDVAAKNSNYVNYANGNKDSQPLLNKEVLEDPTIYPPEATFKNLYTTQPYDQKVQRAVTRIWTAVKGG